MKLTKTLLTSALLATSIFSVQSTAWADTLEQQFQQFQQGVESYNKRDYQTAFKLWLPLAEQGNALVQFNLGLMYQLGQGIKQDNAEAVKWYRKSAEQDHAKAQFNLGVMYNKGKGVKRNPSKAKEWFRKACENGYQKACDVLRELEK